MSLERFTKESAETLVAELSKIKGMTAVVVAPSPIDNFYVVAASLSKNKAEASGRYVWEKTAENVVEHLNNVIAANIDRAKTSKRFLAAERSNNRS